MRGRRACAIPDPNAPAQRHFDERRARPLYRSHRPCAGDDARASRRSILVSGVRPAHFAGGPSLAPLVPRSPFGRDTCRRSRRSSTGRCRTGRAERRLHLERLARAPRIAGEHLLIAGSDKHNYGHYLHDIVPLIDLGARMGAPMLTWTLKALAAGSDRPARGPAGPHPRDQAEAGLSRTCDHLEQVHRPQQPERASPKPRSVRAHSRQCAKACARDEHAAARAHLPQPVKQPKPHQSGGDDRGAQSPRFRRDPAGQAQVRRTGASVRSGGDHRLRVRRRAVERVFLPAAIQRSSRSSPRASTTRGPRISAPCSGLNTSSCSSASPTRSWPACLGM